MGGGRGVCDTRVCKGGGWGVGWDVGVGVGGRWGGERGTRVCKGGEVWGCWEWREVGWG